MRIASTFSLLLLWTAAFAGPYSDLQAQIRSVKSPKQIAQITFKYTEDDPQLKILASAVDAKKGADLKVAVDALKSYIDSGVSAEHIGTDLKASQEAKELKKSPLYRDEKLASANWFGKAGEALWKLLAKLFDFKLPQANTRDMAIPSLFGKWLTYSMWGILVVLLGVLIFFAARYARWQRRLKRKTSALLEEDEPERTLDEWLARADELEAAGKYREAVRCLYLACLLKFDEARIARFDRGQTNWEHLHRIQASPKRPPNLDFQPATKAFDQIWYGMRTRGKEDVEAFRNWYLYVSENLRAAAA